MCCPNPPMSVCFLFRLHSLPHTKLLPSPDEKKDIINVFLLRHPSVSGYPPKLSKRIMSSSTPREWSRSSTVFAIIAGNAHLYPPPTHTYIHQVLPFVITSIAHPYLPPSRTRINFSLSPVSTSRSHSLCPL